MVAVQAGPNCSDIYEKDKVPRSMEPLVALVSDRERPLNLSMCPLRSFRDGKRGSA